MRALKARFDGDRIVLPEEARGGPPGEVIVVFPDRSEGGPEAEAWLAAQEPSFEDVWDNEEDAAYDAL